MTTATETQIENYLRQYGEFEKKAKAPEWLRAIRREAMEAFAELGFPTLRHEDWKYTNVAAIKREEFEPVSSEAGEEHISAIRRRIQALTSELDGPRVVFVNGRYAAELTDVRGSGARIGTLGEALEKRPEAIEPYLARSADYRAHPFVALNTAFIGDGAWIEIPERTVVEKPIAVIHVAWPEGKPAAVYPRNLIVARRESQATVVEIYVGAEVPNYFTNAVTEAVAEENAVLEHVKAQLESERAFHIATATFHQARNSIVRSTTVTLGAALAREEPACVLDGEGGEATLNGLYVLAGTQHADSHTTLDHAKAHCGSREVYKGILEGKSTGVFNGKIIVRPDAQKTDSKQSNKNLLLSPDATINTKPQLEIWADDVKCTHGATIGQMDAEALFYMRSRGIGRKEARNLLVAAFANDVLDRINDAPLRESLKRHISARLAGKGD